MSDTSYKGQRIVPRVYQAGRGSEQEGKWVAGEYSIGKDVVGGYSEMSYTHAPQFTETEQEAIIG